MVGAALHRADILPGAGLEPGVAEAALAELVAAGLVLYDPAARLLFACTFFDHAPVRSQAVAGPARPWPSCPTRRPWSRPCATSCRDARGRRAVAAKAAEALATWRPISGPPGRLEECAPPARIPHRRGIPRRWSHRNQAGAGRIPHRKGIGRVSRVARGRAPKPPAPRPPPPAKGYPGRGRPAMPCRIGYPGWTLARAAARARKFRIRIRNQIPPNPPGRGPARRDGYPAGRRGNRAGKEHAMPISTHASASQPVAPKPPARECAECGRPVEPALLPRCLNQPPRWLEADLCEECLARRQAGLEAGQADAARAALWRAANLPPAARDWDFAAALAQARRLKRGEDLSRRERAFGRCRYWAAPGGCTSSAGRPGQDRAGWCLLREVLSRGRAAFPLGHRVLPAGGGLPRQGLPGPGARGAAKRARLLVLDELGFARPGRRSYLALFAVVDHRVNRRLPTVYTSNLAPHELDKRLGDEHGRVVDRSITAEGVLFEGKSFRLLDAERRW